MILVLDTSFSGDTILLIFPDGTGPALLTCMIGGIPLNRVHELNFEPGEIRFNVTKSRALAMLSDEPTQSYLDKIEEGKVKLKALRENEDSILNVSEQRYEEERQRLQAEIDAKDKLKEENRLAALAKEKERRTNSRMVAQVNEKEKKRQIDDEKEMKQNQDTTKEGSNIVGESAAVIGGIGAIIASTLLGGNSDQVDIDEEVLIMESNSNQTDELIEVNETLPEKSMSNERGSPLFEDLFAEDVVDNPDKTEAEKAVKESAQKLRETSFDSKVSDVRPKESSVREVTVDDYVETYSDGSDAWLQMIQEVIVDQEDDGNANYE